MSTARLWAVLFGIGALAGGVRVVLLNARVVPTSSGGFEPAYWVMVGTTTAAVLMLLVGLLPLVGAGRAVPRAAVHRLPEWLCLVAVVAIGAVAVSGVDGPADEVALTFAATVQLLLMATAMLPVALRVRPPDA